MKTTAETYIDETAKVTALIDENGFEDILSEIKKASDRRKTIFVAGSGLGGITANHFSCDLSKNCGTKIADFFGFGIKVTAISNNMPFFTAASNDICLEKSYSEFLRLYSSAGDLFIAFSCGKPHENLVNAARFAYKNGLRVACLTGAEPEKLADYSHVILKADSIVPSIVDSVHMFVCHSIAMKLKKELLQPAVFLDRDGVINKNRKDYIKSLDEFSFFPGVADAIKRLNQSGYAVIVVTNQAAVGKKIIKKETLDEINSNMVCELYKQGAVINKVYCCLHTPSEHCMCRKPRPGMILRAFNELPIDREKSIMIGDSPTDIIAGKAGGLTTILLTHGKQTENTQGAAPDYSVNDLPHAADLILSDRCLKASV